MKIALVGKGGSGKSSISWLLTKVAHSHGNHVVAIDADHNTNLAPSLGYTVTPQSPTIHHSHSDFLKAVQQSEDKNWSQIILDGRPLPQFSLSPADTYTKNLLIDIAPNLQLILAGLGSHDIVESGRCAHGNISPLKFYLPLLTSDTSDVIIDGVAGVDMLNFGLFTGVDMLICVYDNHPHSISVRDQVTAIATRFDIPCITAHNKLSTHSGTGFTIDTAIYNLDFANVQPHNLAYAETLLAEARKYAVDRTTAISRLKNFEQTRLKNKLHQKT